MNTKEIISQIDSEIARLREVKSVLSGTITSAAKRGRPNKARLTVTPVNAQKRAISPEGRARIAAAQKARWAKAKREKKAA